MSRPNTGRTAWFQVRVTPDESQELSRRAEEAGYKTLSDFARGRLLDGKAPTSRAMSAQTAAIIRELSAIGTALVRVVRLYETQDADARSQLEKCLHDVEATILRV